MNRNSEVVAKKIRELSLRLVYKANASHIGSALSIADSVAVLIDNEDICNLRSPNDPKRDRLILSKGHACVALYSALCIKGYFSEKSLMTYGEDYSPFMNHASHFVPGIDVSTGALGHALSIACGRALAAVLKKEEWHTFVILSDGELQEGSNWEAFMFASHKNLNNVTVIIDYNNLQSLDSVDNTLSLEPLDKKLKAFGWDVDIADGHDHSEMVGKLALAKGSDKPTAVIMRTTKGKGVTYMENSIEWHYKSPSEDQLKDALEESIK